jgi:hypothetical protein
MNKPTNTSLLIMRDGSVVHLERRTTDDNRDHRQVVREAAEGVRRIRTLRVKRQQP